MRYHKTRSMKYLVFVLVFTLATAAGADEINELTSLVDTKKGICADHSFGKTKNLLMQARSAKRAGDLDKADDIMADAHEIFKEEEAAHFTLIGESDKLRGRLMDIKTAVTDMSDADKKKTLESDIRSAEIKLNFCDIAGARQLISELENRI